MTSNATAAAFELNGVGRIFGSSRSTSPPFEALRGVDLLIPEGSLATIVGPSGSGKSTLLGILGLLDTVTSGQLSICGHAATELKEHERVALRAAYLGFVFQSFHLMPDRSVVDNVMLGGIYRGLDRAERQSEARRVLREVGLETKARERASVLSGGERQRVAIARALVGSPRILLCDEPTGNLDSRNGERIVAELMRLATMGMTVVVVTHDASIAELGDFQVAVKDGEVTVIGAATEVPTHR